MMKFKCALSDSQIKKLYAHVYGNMSKAADAKQAFDPKTYMQDLFEKIKNSSDEDTAAKFIQQVPRLMMVAAVKPKTLTLRIDTNPIRDRIIEFNDPENGIENTIKYFKKEVNPDLERSIIESKQNDAFEVKEKDPEQQITTNPARLKPYSVYTATFQEFYALNPNLKDATTQEQADDSKRRIYKTLEKIKNGIDIDNTILDDVVYQGQTLKLKAVRVNQLDQRYIDNYTKDLIVRSISIQNQGTQQEDVTPVQNMLALVITDENGKELYFNDEGDIVSKAEGKLVYQFLRDVRLKNKRYTVTDIYGKEAQILSPKAIARVEGITEEEADRMQQEEFKEVYDFKTRILKTGSEKLDFVSVSPGVDVTIFNNKLSFNRLKGLSVGTRDVFTSIRVADEFSDYDSGTAVITIKGQDFNIDRPAITNELSQKIAAVLTDRNLTPTEKNDYVSQFLSNNLSESVRRHRMIYDPKNKVFGFSFNRFTLNERNKNKVSDEVTFDLRDLRNYSDGELQSMRQDIINVLDKASSNKKKEGDYYPAKIRISKENLESRLFLDYDMATGKIIPAQDYINFIMNTNASVIMNPETDPGFFNSYIQYRLPSKITKEVSQAKAEVQQKDERSQVRKLKDATVDYLNTKDGTAEVTVTYSDMGSIKDNDYAYFGYISSTPGFTGMSARVYMDFNLRTDEKMLPKEGDIITLQVEDAGLGIPAIVAYNENGDRIGQQQETDYAGGEAARDYSKIKPTEEKIAVDIEESLNPTDVPSPDDSNISGISDLFSWDRKGSLPNNVTQADIDNATKWWNESPLSKFVKLQQVANIVNSDAYARFTVSATNLIDAKILLSAAKGGNMVDVYHESWHVFSQLFLTKNEKIKLYNELRNSSPKYKNLSFLELEEILAEDFRSYALKQSVKKDSPTRNSLFRRILNFLKNLFKSPTYKNELFDTLYLAGKNPKLLNKYTPLVDNVMFDMLNRGAGQVSRPNEQALSRQDSLDVVDSMDSIYSQVTDDVYTDRKNKSQKLNRADLDHKGGVIKLLTNPSDKVVAYDIIKQRLQNKLDSFRTQLGSITDTKFDTIETAEELKSNAAGYLKDKNGVTTYVYLTSQVDSYKNLSLSTAEDQRIKGYTFEGVDIMTDFYRHNSIKNENGESIEIMVVPKFEDAITQFDNFSMVTDEYTTVMQTSVPETVPLTIEQQDLLDKVRILQTAINNYGDAKSGMVKYHMENSDYNILREKYVELDDVTSSDDLESSDRAGGKTELGELSLEQMASKETLYILSSLHKKTNGKFEYNSLGFKKRADFKTMWNNAAKLIAGVKDPFEQYRLLKEASAKIPEFEQLVNFKLPEPSTDAAGTANRNEFRITSAFFKDFGRKTKYDYMQNTIFEDGKIEVITASVSTPMMIAKFVDNFKTNLTNPFAERGPENTPMLKLGEVVTEFTDKNTGKFNINASIAFAEALGIKLDYSEDVFNELTKEGAAGYYGLPYVFELIKTFEKMEADPKTSLDARKFIIEFKQSPVSKLKEKFPSGILGKEFSQATQIKRLAELQIKFGAEGNLFSTVNPEGSTVYQFANDHTASMTVYGINQVERLDQLWTTDKFKSLSWLDPRVNPYTKRLQTFRNLFDFADPQIKKRQGKELKIFVDSGSQVIDEIGNKTTSLDVYGKSLQEINGFLKGGKKEFMRIADKSSAYGFMIDGDIIDGTGAIKKDKKLWVDIDRFALNTGENYAIDVHLMQYIAAEVDRINMFNNDPDMLDYDGYNRVIGEDKDGNDIYAGSRFTAFDNILRKETKNEIYEKVKSGDLIEYLKTDPELEQKIRKDLIDYFNEQTEGNLDFLQKNKHISPDLLDKLTVFNLSDKEKENVLMKAYTYNSWIHNFEMGILFTGDFATYDHAGDAYHKRNSGAFSNGDGFRNDVAAQNFVNVVLRQTSYGQTLNEKINDPEQNFNGPRFDGTLNTAIIQEIEKDSEYLPIYEKAFRDYYTKQFAKTRKEDIVEWFTKSELAKIDDNIQALREALVNKFVELETDAYRNMKIADGQGYITLDAYRNLKWLENDWSDPQEALFKKVIAGKKLKADEIDEFFPVYKLQNFGHLADTKLPVNAMHKFSLMPLIPGMYPEGSNFDRLHKQMMKNGIHYATFQSGSKAGSVSKKGTATEVFKTGTKDRVVKDNIDFIPNKIYIENIKKVASMANYFKGKTIYASQARGIGIDNLFDNGKLVHENLKEQYENYRTDVAELREILEEELLAEIGFEKVDGKYKGDLTKFMLVVQEELTRRDVPEHLVKFIGVNRDNTLKVDLSFHPNADQIEKLIVSMVQKRLVKQKVNGEAFIQVSSVFTEDLWKSKLSAESIEEVRKFQGTTSLPFYRPLPNGKTAAPKVAIALQGDFNNLLSLKYKGKEIEDIDTLNIAIKDDEWLDANDGENRKAITLFSVRIPIDSLGTMLYPEVFHFLAPVAGNAIIVPDELVASSGSDFDGDKLTTALPNIKKSGKLYTKKMSNKELSKEVERLKKSGEKGKALQLIRSQKKAIENNLIQSMKGILEAPENFVNLIRPNGVYYFRSLADDLETKVSDYNKFSNMHGEPVRIGKGGKKAMSPTRVLEERHNLNKFQKNLEGRKSLGLTAVNNKLNPILNSIGAKMPSTYKASYYDDKKSKYIDLEKDYKTRIFLPTNKIVENGVEYISLSRAFAADNIANISVSFSHKLNGQLDVGKDDWIFNIQSNPQIEPISSHLSEAGVPIKSYIYFISNPLVREYAEQQRIYKSSYARFTGNTVSSPSFVKYQSSKDVLEQYIPELLKDAIQKSPESMYVTWWGEGINLFTGEPTRTIKAEQLSKDELRAMLNNNQIDPTDIRSISDNKSDSYKIERSRYVNPVPTNKNFYDLSTFYASKADILNEKNEFDLDRMKDAVNDPNNPENLFLKVAMFIHFLELEKQVKGIDSLKRQMNPDTKTDKTLQETSGREASLEDLNELSKLDQDTKNKALNESILAPFFNNKLIKELIELVFPFRNNEVVSDFIVKSLRENYGPITKKFGFGREGTAKFITKFKDSIANYAYQNNVPTIFDPEGNEITYQRMVSTGEDGYTSMLFDIIKKHLNTDKAKRNYPILQQLTPITKYGVRTVTLNDRRDLEGNLASIYYSNLKDLANPNIRKVDNPETNIVISQMFSLLPQISMYLNGQGYSPYGINNALPYDGYVDVMQRISNEFITNQLNENTLSTILSTLIGDYKKPTVFTNYKQTVEPTTPAVIPQVNPLSPDLQDENAAGELPTVQDLETGELVSKKTFGQPSTPTQAPVSQTNKPKGEQVKEGIYVNQGSLTKEEQLELFNYLKPFLEEQADKSLKATQGSKMIGLGLRWDYTSNNPGKTPINIPDPIIRNPKYGYYDQSVNRQPLGQITPRFRELMQKATGVDMTNYDGAIINLYEKDTFISSHNDVDESRSAIKYPVIGINLGGKGNFSIEPRDGSKIQTLDLQAGTGYIFGVDSINRKVFHRTFATPQDSFLPELTTKIDGKTYEPGSYRVTITMRRVKPLEVGMPEAPSIVSDTAQPAPTQAPVVQGVEISSNAKGLAAALTNPTELAKSKGNLTQSYPIEFRGKTYKDAEAAYQALKSTATKDDGPNSTYNLMVNIIKAKLEQHPRLVSEITKQGGSAWILSSTHQPTKANTVWETGGKNWFIKSLNDAYVATTQPTVQPVGEVKEGVSELFDSNPELANIGTPEQYSQYLDTIFPDSKVKDIVYHGTDKQFEKFISDNLGSNTKAEDADRGFAFTANKNTAKTYGKNIKAALLNAYNIETVSPLSEQYEDIIKPEFPSLKKQILDLKKLIESQEKVNSINRVEDLPNSFYTYSEKIKSLVNIVREGSAFYAYVNGKKINDKLTDKQALAQFEKTKKDTTELTKQLNLLTDENTVFVYKNIIDDRNIESTSRSNVYFAKPNQILVLGSKQDIQGFKNFVSQPTPTGGIQYTIPIDNISVEDTSDVRREVQDDLNEFQRLLRSNDGNPPSTFKVGEYRTWMRNERGLYDLVDEETGDIYVRDYDMMTGTQRLTPETRTPVDEKLRAETIKRIKDGIAEYRLDTILAVKGYDVNEVISNLENAQTQEELSKIRTELFDKLC